jgi:N-acetylglucosamine kinase-like BadF-type ATPase
MKYLIGIDGGGSKTKMECYDLSGKLINQIRTDSTDYHTVGIDNVINILTEGFRKLGVSLSDCLISFGMPAYGENKTEDAKAVSQIKNAFSPTEFNIENDVFSAWAGATALSNGVTVVCGTGSMAVGRDSTGKIVRCGGWLPFFSDEGSGYWIGLHALELFSKQSDGRLPRGSLYSLMQEHLGIKEDDFEAFHILSSQYENSRVQIASLQMIMLEAYKQGDSEVGKVYKQAISELVLIVKGTVDKLNFGSDIIDISYIGGLFNEKVLFLDPFAAAIEKNFQARVNPPKLSPSLGAILLALEKSDKQLLSDFKSNLL